MYVAGLLLAAPFILAAFSVLSTVIHTVDEVVSTDTPIWEYLGLTDRYGWGLSLLVGFGCVQALLAGVGYGYGREWALALLVTIRLADVLVSHVIPYVRGRRPNPGLSSVPYYLLDAAAGVATLAGW